MNPKKLDEIKSMKQISEGSRSAKNVDWDSLREYITGNDLAYTAADILELTKEYSLITLESAIDKVGEPQYDVEGFPVMRPPISQMRARDFLVKEWQKGRALRHKTYEVGKGIRIYYVFPLHGGVGRVRAEDGAHPDYFGTSDPEPKVIKRKISLEEEVLLRHREAKERRKQEKEQTTETRK